MSMQRRKFLSAAGAGLVAAQLPLSAAAQAAGMQTTGSAQAFDYAQLKGRARVLAAAPYQPNTRPLPAAVAAMDYDQFQSIQFRSDHALWANERLRFQVKFFHLGMFFKRPVQMFEVTNGQAQQLAYDPTMFNFGKSGLAASALPADLGFALSPRWGCFGTYNAIHWQPAVSG